MKNSSFLILISVFILFSCESKVADMAPKWYKGNLHTHSYWSDGDEFPEMIMEYYKSNDYQFIALSDHNVVAKGEKWKTINDDSLYQQAFQNYLTSYGAEWVNYEIDSMDRTRVKLKTYEEYQGLFVEEEKFLIFQSEEISDKFENKPLHLNAHNIEEKIQPQGGGSVVEVLQNNIDEVIRLRKERNVPMLVHVNHPNFGNAISLSDMIALENERFFEVFNGHPHVHNSGDSTHMSTEEMWDKINISYLQNEKDLIFGLATDDSHNYHRIGKEWSNASRGWIEVRADSLSTMSLIEAMEAGDFYASTGVELEDVRIENNALIVEVKKEEGITYHLDFIGCKKGETVTKSLQKSVGTINSFPLNEEILFVRCKIISSKAQANPIEHFVYESAWTQPVLGL